MVCRRVRLPTGSAATLTIAVTVAIAEAMEERAERRGGRLDPPALALSGGRLRWPSGAQRTTATDAPDE